MKKITLIICMLTSVAGLAQQISDLYERASPAVVLIKTLSLEPIGPIYFKSIVNRAGQGSGFVVSEKGEILTASHVVQTADHILVKFSDGEEIPAQVVYSYPFADVALIKLTRPKSTPLTIAVMADSDDSRIGDQIFVIGAPFGLGNSLSVGYISGKYKGKDRESGFTPTELIQTDAAINEGSSGAPMFNIRGEVIGIASFIISNNKGFQGMSFAATSNMARKLLKEQHSVWTGLDVYPVTGLLAEILNVPQSSGLLVQKVAANSPGAMLGLQGSTYMMTLEGEEILVGGDIILAFENMQLIGEENIFSAWQLLQSLKAGDSLRFQILRKGKIMLLKGIMP